MDNAYEDLHLHLGYYKDGYDLEAIAFKRKEMDIWDIYFDLDQYGIPLAKGNNYVSPFGYKLLTVYSRKLTDAEGSREFKKWLKENRVI